MPETYDPIAAGLAVQLGDTVDQGLEKDGVFPFVYNFVSPEDSNTQAGFLGSPLLAAGASHNFYVRFDPDYHFWLHHARYRALNVSGGGQYYEAELTAGLGTREPDFQTEYRTYWYRFVNVSLWFGGSGQRVLYGGQNLDPNSGAGLQPIPLSVLQGYFYGVGEVTTPYLLPRNAVVVVRVTNNHPSESLHVNGALLGSKVRL